MEQTKIFSNLLNKEITLDTYTSNNKTVISSPSLKLFFDTQLTDYLAVPELVFYDDKATIYHVHILHNDKEVICGVGETHTSSLAANIMENRAKLAEMKAFSDAVIRLLGLPVVFYTDAQILPTSYTIKPKPQENEPLEEANVIKNSTENSASTNAPALEPSQTATQTTQNNATAETPKAAPVQESETNSLISFNFEDADGSFGFVTDDTIVGIEPYADKTCGYVIAHANDETKAFVNSLKRAKVSEQSMKKKTVIVRYIRSKTA
jgi:hypothetical protein